jgi:hypothetical protein
LAVLRPGPVSPASIASISEEAIAIDTSAASEPAPQEVFELDILAPGFNQGVMVDKVTVRKVSETIRPGDGGGAAARLRRLVLAFSRLDSEQRGRIRGFIAGYGR